jgi:hypothetical protein
MGIFFPRRGKYPPKAGDGGEAPVEALDKVVDLDCGLAPSASLRSAPQRNRLRRFARPPGEEFCALGDWYGLSPWLRPMP